jgi:hypothetical protein
VFVKLCRISQENGQVEQIKRELVDAEAASTFAGVCIWRSDPSKGQNHILINSYVGDYSLFDVSLKIELLLSLVIVLLLVVDDVSWFSTF